MIISSPISKISLRFFDAGSHTLSVDSDASCTRYSPVLVIEVMTPFCPDMLFGFMSLKSAFTLANIRVMGTEMMSPITAATYRAATPICEYRSMFTSPKILHIQYCHNKADQ